MSTKTANRENIIARGWWGLPTLKIHETEITLFFAGWIRMDQSAPLIKRWHRFGDWFPSGIHTVGTSRKFIPQNNHYCMMSQSTPDKILDIYMELLGFHSILQHTDATLDTTIVTILQITASREIWHLKFSIVIVVATALTKLPVADTHGIMMERPGNKKMHRYVIGCAYCIQVNPWFFWRDTISFISIIIDTRWCWWNETRTLALETWYCREWNAPNPIPRRDSFEVTSVYFSDSFDAHLLTTRYLIRKIEQCEWGCECYDLS